MAAPMRTPFLVLSVWILNCTSAAPFSDTERVVHAKSTPRLRHVIRNAKSPALAFRTVLLSTDVVRSTNPSSIQEPSSPVPFALSSNVSSPDGSASHLDPAKLAWLHIPKTGTSFANTLVSWACSGLDEGDVVDESYADATGAFIPAFMMRHRQRCDPLFKLSGGHIPIKKGTPNGWDGHKGSFVAMFRQPEQRIISGFYNDLHDVSDKSISLREYAERMSGCSVRMVLGLFCGDQVDMTASMVKDAAERLDAGFAFIGITEEWTLSVCLFHKMFGGKCHQREFMNVRPGMNHTSSGSYDNSDLAGFRDPFDGALYAHATTIFWQNVQKYGVSHDSCQKTNCSKMPGGFD